MVHVSERDEALGRVADALVRERSGVALTGAGVSVDSGIPDFRSPGGLWERFDPMEYATIEAFVEDPGKVWRMLAELDELVRGAKPNPGHVALARLEHMGVVQGVVTQNVDGLHQAAGSKRVLELHGSGSRLRCLGCDRAESAADMGRFGFPPRCSCGRVLKPDVVLFGEPLPEQALSGALELALRSRVMLVVGTSATVAPASMIPVAARRAGAMIVEVNLGATELSGLCEETLVGGASRTLPRLADLVQERIEAGPRQAG